MRNIRLNIMLAAACGLCLAINPVFAQGTAFVYQGHLDAAGGPVNGYYDLSFGLYQAASGGSPTAGPITLSATPVSNGLFSATIDFGPGYFDGTPYWLEIGARTNNSNLSFSILAPRQALSAVPYALFATNAGSLAGQSSTAFAPASGSPTYVAKSGDVMSGSLNLSAPAALDFGVTTRQMVNLFSSTYGIGVQASTFYQRTAANAGFAWYAGGAHNDAQNNPGGGVSLMQLDSLGDLTLSGNLYTTGGVLSGGVMDAENGLIAGSSTGIGIYGSSTAGDGIYGSSSVGYGIHGSSSGSDAIHGSSSSSLGAGVYGENTGGGFAANFQGNVNISGYTTYGATTRQMIDLYSSTYGIGVQASTFYQRTAADAGFAWYEGGTHADDQNDPGGGTSLMTLSASGNLYVNATGGANAIYGNNSGATGVAGTSGTGDGVYGASGSGYGVYGSTTNDTSSGVYGENLYSGAVYAYGDGVTGVAHASYGRAVHGLAIDNATSAGFFDGAVDVTTDLYVGGSKHFKIDHPLDPANKYLVHASIESPDVKNLYDGNITTDGAGEATVVLPSYFEALNRDFRYQLTVIGQFAQAMVASKIQGNQFTIKTDKPNVEVSWQVTGIRQDAYMKAHPMVVEQDKPANERGTYIHPELFGQPEEKSLSWKQNPELWKRLKAERAKPLATLQP
jgi:hypothetical protein